MFPVSQCAFIQKHHSRQAPTCRRERRRAGVSSQVNTYLRDAITQCRLQGNIHSTLLGHKELSSTMVYARAHDQTVAEDYFAAMERVEQRLEIVPAKQNDIEVVKVQEPVKVLQLIERLELPELCFEERLDITLQLRELFGVVRELEPVMALA